MSPAAADGRCLLQHDFFARVARWSSAADPEVHQAHFPSPAPRRAGSGWLREWRDRVDRVGELHGALCVHLNVSMYVFLEGSLCTNLTFETVHKFEIAGVGG